MLEDTTLTQAAPDNVYASPWQDDGDLEINVIGVMLSVLKDAKDWGSLDAKALLRIKTYISSKIDDEVSKLIN